VATLLAHAARRGVAPSYVSRLLSVFPHGPLIEGAVTRAKTASSAPRLPLAEPLSEREIEILRLVAQGLSNQQLANRLFITVGTTKWHLNNIYGKLGVASRTQAVALARELKLI
jgi:LuxR family maltose regulon positive regulatory protein